MVPFLKMHGLGNDFVVIDGRGGMPSLDEAAVRAIGDRRRGVGFDQLLLIESPRNGSADAFMRIYNPDGSEAGACGNGTRCVASLLMGDNGAGRCRIETRRGVLEASAVGDLVTVDMGAAQLDWADIPLVEPMETDRLPIAEGPLRDPVAVGMGNPHCVFFVADAEAIDLPALGPKIEHHPLFPARTNVEVASVRADGSIRLRVWERGAGITLACGSGTCATVVAAVRRGLIDGRAAEVQVDGGRLAIEWRESDGHVLMTGPVATSFAGELPL